MKTLQKNIHLILTEDEWNAVLNCVDLSDAMIHGWPMECVELKDDIIRDFRSKFSHEFLEKVSNKLSWKQWILTVPTRTMDLIPEKTT